MSPARFRHAGSDHVLAPGQRYSSSPVEGFRDASDEEMRRLVCLIEAGRPWREVVREQYQTAKPWLHRIITDPCRTSFFRTVLPEGSGAVLDIGAGWGQTCRPLAEQRTVIALEPMAERLAFIQAAAQQDGVAHRIGYIQADYLDVEFRSRFAVVCAIGVLEWVGAFQDRSDPQQRQLDFLRKIHRELSDTGCLILGIENRLGLKYLLGCPDDHLGVPNIACLPAELARPRWQAHSGHPLRSFTYSRNELQQMLRAAGFSRIEFFAAFPDYKVPAHIFSLNDGGRLVNEWLAHPPNVAEHNGYDGTPLPETMAEALTAHYHSLAAENSAHVFVPSFFVRAHQ